VQALRGLSLAVPRGQIVALLGSNGAGKSTTLKAVSGLLALEDGLLASGSVRYNGQSTARYAPQQLVRLGLSHVMEGGACSRTSRSRKTSWPPPTRSRAAASQARLRPGLQLLPAPA
jgi:ABC-type branched-subunit amino acid transport system ATPase component